MAQDKAFSLQRERGLHFYDLADLALTVHGSDVSDEDAAAQLRRLTADQVGELDALACGQRIGDPEECLGLRTLGLQDDGLGTTPLGAAAVRVSRYNYRKRAELGAEWSWA